MRGQNWGEARQWRSNDAATRLALQRHHQQALRRPTPKEGWRTKWLWTVTSDRRNTSVWLTCIHVTEGSAEETRREADKNYRGPGNRLCSICFFFVIPSSIIICGPYEPKSFCNWQSAYLTSALAGRGEVHVLGGPDDKLSHRLQFLRFIWYGHPRRIPDPDIIDTPQTVTQLVQCSSRNISCPRSLCRAWRRQTINLSATDFFSNFSTSCI